jgi:Flp pilus assembly protein TadD
MSLLMEALRKAEEAKRKSQETDAPPAPASAAAIPAEDPAPASAAGLRSTFLLEPREPESEREPLPDPIPEPEPATAPEPAIRAPLRDAAARSVIIETPRDEVQDYLVADPAPEDSPTPQVSTGRRLRGTRSSRDQLAAASVFAAKQGTQRDGTRQKRLMVLMGSGLFVLVSGGATLWYLQTMPSSGLAINPGIANYDLASRGLMDEQVSTAVADPAAGAPAAVVTEPAAAPEPALAAAIVQVPETGTDIGTQATPPAVDPGAAASAPAEAAAAPPEAPATLAAASTPPTPPVVVAPAAPQVATAQPTADAQSASPPLDSPSGENAGTSASRTLEISRSTSRNVVNSTLQSAWNALQAGDLQTAALLYTEVLGEQPNDRDALIGMAAIQLRNGQLAQARETYLQLLTLNPQDPYARTGLLQASQTSSDPAHETELKNLLQRYPELPPLHFALGNFHAGQQRWNEAQAAYFDALLYANRDSSTPVSPDYAFNLAVSLEQLQQPAAALNYYRQALELSRSSPAGFDMSLLQSRLGLLQELMQE